MVRVQLVCGSSCGFADLGELLLGLPTCLSRGIRGSLDSHLSAGIMRRPDQLVATRAEFRFESATQ